MRTIFEKTFVYEFVKHYTIRKSLSEIYFFLRVGKRADPSGNAVLGVGLRPLACWDSGFESRRQHGYLSVVSFVCCQLEVSATG